MVEIGNAMHAKVCTLARTAIDYSGGVYGQAVAERIHGYVELCGKDMPEDRKPNGPLLFSETHDFVDFAKELCSLEIRMSDMHAPRNAIAAGDRRLRLGELQAAMQMTLAAWKRECA